VTELDLLRATRVSYDAVASSYAERFGDEPAGKPVELAMLTAFAGVVRASGGGPVADVGCGPGGTTAFLRGQGVDAFGVDLSAGMVATARRAHPGVRFEVGSMLALDVADGALGGLLAYYSTIHLPDGCLPDLFAEFRRVLAPGGWVLLVFQVGDEPMTVSEWLGHPVELRLYRRRPAFVAELLAGAGLSVRARALREPEDDGVESSPRACLLARSAPG
jgi:SAM-dependent methyltransferase